MNRIVFLVFVFLSTNSISQEAQVNEIGFFTGTGYYIGDLNKNHFSQQDICLGAIFKTDFRNERMSLRFQLMYNKLKADDIESNVLEQIYRNLSFESEVIEFGPVLEIDFFPFHPGQNHTDEPDFGSPYFLVGINYMRMNPKTKYGDSLYALQPLRTEGQTKPYALNQIVIPFGLGVKMNITHHLSFCIEYAMRKTFTDFLDDVSGLYADPSNWEDPTRIALSDKSKSYLLEQQPGLERSNVGFQRGNSSTKDWYAVSGITLTYEFFKDVVCPKW
ncbi:MAG: hypothetical protein CL827_08725 [Crocinitomicaceae bacterium]|nr:hypothetical protein [Crocinitomicaceae bacterium]|tara:strand:- start:8218 stop:9042 length:825 start_codon:yes stop_codon:yes gene_type:complete